MATSPWAGGLAEGGASASSPGGVGVGLGRRLKIPRRRFLVAGFSAAGLPGRGAIARRMRLAWLLDSAGEDGMPRRPAGRCSRSGCDGGGGSGGGGMSGWWVGASGGRFFRPAVPAVGGGGPARPASPSRVPAAAGLRFRLTGMRDGLDFGNGRP